MKKVIGVSVLAAFIGGAAAIGGYKMIEPKIVDGGTISGMQSAYFASNPGKISSAGSVDFIQAAAAVSPAVVHIKTTYDGGSRNSDYMPSFEDLFGGGGGGGRRRPGGASGSGVVLTADGYIVTNNHVVDKADKIEVILTDKRKVEAKVIGKDPNTDLALIKIEARNLPFVKVGNSDNVQVGEWVLAVGFPLDLQTTVTAGIVSAKARSIGIIGRSEQGSMSYEEYQEYRRTGKVPTRTNQGIESFIQTDAAINPGNSGGALINASGELIGINAAIASNTGYNEGYGFAIPINLAKKILDDFMKYGAVKRGYIGVTFEPVNAENAEEIKMSDLTGLLVNGVSPGSAAEAAGLKAGDVIKKIDNVTLYDSPDLQERIGRLSPGDKVSLTIFRDGSLKTVSVTLKGETPKEVEKTLTSVGMVEELGATFNPASDQVKARYNIKNGAVVGSVAPGSTFDNLGVQKGVVITSVNNMPVNSTKDIKAALATSKNGMVALTGVSGEGMFSYKFPIE